MQNKNSSYTASRNWYNYLKHCIHCEKLTLGKRLECLSEYIKLGKKLERLGI